MEKPRRYKKSVTIEDGEEVPLESSKELWLEFGNSSIYRDIKNILIDWLDYQRDVLENNDTQTKELGMIRGRVQACRYLLELFKMLAEEEEEEPIEKKEESQDVH